MRVGGKRVCVGVRVSVTVRVRGKLVRVRLG